MTEQNGKPDWMDDPDWQSEFVKLKEGHNVLVFEDNGHNDDGGKYGKRVVFTVNKGKKFTVKNRKLLAELGKLHPLQGKKVHIYRAGLTQSDTRYTEIREATNEEIKAASAASSIQEVAWHAFGTEPDGSIRMVRM